MRQEVNPALDHPFSNNMALPILLTTFSIGITNKQESLVENISSVKRNFYLSSMKEPM